MTLPVIDIRHIHRIYETEAGLTHALRGVSEQIALFARKEELEGHARSVLKRFEQ